MVFLLSAFSALSVETNTVDKFRFAPTAAYREEQIEGWRVLVNTNLLAEKDLWERTSKLLHAQLYQITRVVPDNPLAKLRQIPIWVEHSSEKFPCMCYHESRDWLTAHNVNPEKTGAVELATVLAPGLPSEFAPLRTQKETTSTLPLDRRATD